MTRSEDRVVQAACAWSRMQSGPLGPSGIDLVRAVDAYEEERERMTSQRNTARRIGVDLMTLEEVAALFAVEKRTVSRWAATGRLTSIRTPGGYRRFRRHDVEAAMQEEEREHDVLADNRAA